MDSIYLDYNASSKVHKKVVEDVKYAYEYLWQNPSAIYDENRIMNAVGSSRSKIARLLHVTDSSKIFFTSGGTESNNWAIHQAILTRIEDETAHVVTTRVEHDSVCCKLIDGVGFYKVKVNVSFVDGLFCALDVISKVRDDTCLISIILAQNETGIIYDVASVGKKLREINDIRAKNGLKQIFFHIDASQAIGKVAFGKSKESICDIEGSGIDMVTVCGHKFCGPRIGALYVRENASPMIFGGGQELGMRSGTLNVADIIGLGTAAEIAFNQLENDVDTKHLETIRQAFVNVLRNSLGSKCRINFTDLTGYRLLPNTLSICFPIFSTFKSDVRSRMLRLLAEEKVYCSAGAACHTDKECLSPNLLGCGLNEADARSTLRFSFGWDLSSEQVDVAAERIKLVVEKLRAISLSEGR